MIRTATVDDVPEILAMINELAAYHREPDQARATEEQLHEALFGTVPAAHALMAEDEETGEAVGFALWFPSFSTWTGVRGMHLEDLFVRPAARGAGHGTALLAALAAICVDSGFERFEWCVLAWNEPTITFYKSIGARIIDDWRVVHLTGEPLAALAAR
ncbi:GNAT family N-acetyltransferase [Streptomyces sp. NBC_00582]|uniref:GNAT family N-acetyltransferase n=1 Tax=Streptomyces sp. NBC_00582 TaxID=2975783 RepID=UPI001063C68C|nr:GNAT family N-acetyltransferase [Streptomyces sp. NBC_00582]WUB63174.1 GNAT family N-acetyltransferase [Streptomyces sp. NBC_00582]